MVSQWFSPIFNLFGIRRQQPLPKRTLFVLGTILFVAVFGGWLANDPQKSFVPPLIPYSAKASDTANSPYFSPFVIQSTPSVYYRHWLGTDELGRDVAAGIISGTRTALFIGLGGVLLALFIGLPIGLAAGFYGDNRLEVNIWAFILRGGVLLLLLFYFFVFLNLKESGIWILIKLLSFFILSQLIINVLQKYIFEKIKFLKTKITLPLDLIVMRLKPIE